MEGPYVMIVYSTKDEGQTWGQRLRAGGGLKNSDILTLLREAVKQLESGAYYEQEAP